MRFLAVLAVLSTGCFFTSMHNPRAHDPGQYTVGAHVAFVGTDDADGFATPVSTVRYGTEVGEIGGTLSFFAADVSFKVPITPRDGAVHVSALAGAGMYLFAIGEVNLGVLAGVDAGPITPYAGFRQHAFTPGLYMGHAIAGFEIRITRRISLMAEANYNVLFNEDAGDEDESFIDAFDIPVFTVGLNFGNGRDSEQSVPRIDIPPPPPPPGPPPPGPPGGQPL